MVSDAVCVLSNNDKYIKTRCNILVILAVRDNTLARLCSDTNGKYSCFYYIRINVQNNLDKITMGYLWPMTSLTRRGNWQDGLVTKIC